MRLLKKAIAVTLILAGASVSNAGVVEINSGHEEETVSKTALKTNEPASSTNYFSQVNTTGWYTGIDYVLMNLDIDSHDVSPSALQFKLGSRLHNNFAIEARLGTNASDDSVNADGVKYDVEVNNYYGIYAKIIAPLRDGFEIYGMFGRTTSELSYSLMGDSDTEKEDDVSYGIGLNIATTDNIVLNAEFVSLLSGADYDLTAFTAGVEFKF